MMFKIAQNKTPCATVQIRANASEAECFAAHELQRYVHKITGANLVLEQDIQATSGVRIVIADVSCHTAREAVPSALAEGLEEDGHRIATDENAIYILSRDPAGVVFGVYQYLRHACGCRFYDLGEKGETVPGRAVLEHSSLNRIDNPACWYRALQANACDEPQHLLLNRIDWMAKNGYRHVLINYKKMDGVSSKSSDTAWGKYRAWLMPELSKRGLKYTLGHHNFSFLIPYKKYFDKKPEFFALVDGVRKPTGQFQFCLSNPDLIEEITRRLEETIDANPEADTVALWPDDGVGEFCECENCKALDNPHDYEDTFADSVYGAQVDGVDNIGRRGERHRWRRYLHLCNQVAQRLAVTYPAVKLSAIAYVDFVDPPLRDVQIHQNIVVHLAIYWRCSKHLLQEQNCPINRQYADIIKDWLKVLSPRQILLTTYEAGMGCWKSLPFPIAGGLAKEWAALNELGIGGVKSNAMTQHWGVFGLNYVALANALRKSPVPFDDLLKDYCRSLFGEAASAIEEFFLLWEHRIHNADAPCITPSPFEFINAIFTQESMDRSYSLCQQALKLCGTPEEKWRVNRLVTILDYTQINREAPAEPLIRFLRTREKESESADSVEKWLTRDAEFVSQHFDDSNYLFPKNFAEQMRKGWLMQI